VREDDDGKERMEMEEERMKMEEERIRTEREDEE
jgi:hypothetical protein